MNWLIAWMLSCLIDTAIIAVDPPYWFCALFGFISFVACFQIVNWMTE